jgi:hypothetical protein
MRNRWERMCEQLIPLEILQAIPLFPEAAGYAGSGAGSAGGAGGYISGEGWAQWDQAPWSEITLTWSEMV